MKRIAVLLTVYNRKEVTLKGLRSLYNAIAFLKNLHPKKDYCFDVYMTDDGCTDGTGDAVKEEFPGVYVVQGDGNLYWGGGMIKAWEKAVDNKVEYHYFLWFNDDSILNEDALELFFRKQGNEQGNDIIVGAFCDKNSCPSYGGRIGKKKISANGEYQEIELMNGNLVLIPHLVYEKVGMIDRHLIHSEGDFDYGLRAKKKGFRLLLTPRNVGYAERHDEEIPKCYSKDLSFKQRWTMLHSPFYSPFNHFIFNTRYKGIVKASFSLMICYVSVLFPAIYIMIKNRK